MCDLYARATGRDVRPPKVNCREKPKDKVAIVALAALREAQGGWWSAIEVEAVARRLLPAKVGIAWPWSYRPIAFALRRLARAGLVQERIIQYRGTARTKEERRQYRLITDERSAERLNPFELRAVAPPPGASRRIVGRGMRDDDSR
ncbi:hypothetical protein GO613_00460 [Azoarcus communis]|uniref:hypothetical protein n=1 Tax=Parazoarcus communis TaxID=41977 RepID=UPI001459B486|nr:hypothetical protein [Parazoarcus communis]NMG46581.1 hypothetical protein [Parazoarcus communis]